MMSLKSFLIALSLLVSAQAFAPAPTTSRATTSLAASIPQEWKDKAAVASAALVTANLPVWAALAVVDDDYEYGAVDAPPLVPIVGGVLAILTALLPIALKPGEEAFEEVCWGIRKRLTILRVKAV